MGGEMWNNYKEGISKCANEKELYAYNQQSSKMMVQKSMPCQNVYRK